MLPGIVNSPDATQRRTTGIIYGRCGCRVSHYCFVVLHIVCYSVCAVCAQQQLLASRARSTRYTDGAAAAWATAPPDSRERPTAAIIALVHHWNSADAVCVTLVQCGEACPGAILPNPCTSSLSHPPNGQVLSASQICGNGSCFDDVCLLSYMSEATVCTSFHTFCERFAEELYNIHVGLPRDASQEKAMDERG